MDVSDLFPSRQDDGLLVEEVRSWSEEKYHLVQHYTSLFCKSMKGKWQCLVYIDLYAGPGRSKIDGKRVIDAPPILAINSGFLFNKYIFNDVSTEKYEALEKRLEQYKDKTEICVLNGDSNLITENVLHQIPQHSRTNKVLGFCFLDPYKVENLKFETIRTLSSKFIDFLVLIPTGMDVNRNAAIYEKSENKKLDEFIGNDEWRKEWNNLKKSRNNFGDFVAGQFSKSMEKLGYINPGVENMKLIRSDEKNLPLYRLALYSRHKLGSKFWKETVKYTNPQSDMFG